MLSRSTGWLLAGSLVVSGCAAAPYYANPSPKAFLPQKGKQQALGETRLVPKQILMETPVGFREAARLESPVSVTLVGKTFAFAPGDVLAGATITGAASGQIPAGAKIMCGTPRVDVAKNLLSASTLGITSVLNRTGTSTQLCLIDAQGDGRAEQAILVGIKSLKDAAPVAIGAAAYAIVENEPMAGESVARIMYDGKPGKTGGGINFRLAVIEGGTPLFFNNTTTRVALKNLPQRVSLMGAAFTVKSYNPVDGSVIVDVERGLQDGNYGITTTTTTTYIPIYVPR